MKYGELTLGQTEAIVNKLGGMEGVKRLLADELKVVEVLVAKAIQGLLELLGTITRPATSDNFVAKERITSGRFYIGNNFTTWFLGKTEEPQNAVTLRYHKLLKWLRDLAIIADLGGEERVETTLTDIFWLVEQQKDGKEGTLLVNGYANIFYVRDIDGVLRAVGVYRDDDRWIWDAYPIDYAGGWGDGRRVFSRNLTV